MSVYITEGFKMTLYNVIIIQKDNNDILYKWLNFRLKALTVV